MLGALRSCAARLIPSSSSTVSSRGVAAIPHWEYHIRFDQRVGRKRPCRDVLDRFKRLNNGLWIRAHAGRHVRRYQKDEKSAVTAEYFETCNERECRMLDKMVTPFWLRPKYYPDDPYAAYHVRHGVTSPRMGFAGELKRERRKILLEDSVADPHFRDR